VYALKYWSYHKCGTDFSVSESISKEEGMVIIDNYCNRKINSTSNKNCAELTFKRFNLTLEEADTQELLVLLMLTLNKNDDAFNDYITKATPRAVDAYVYHIRCIGFQ
jgi:hypothetical protein